MQKNSQSPPLWCHRAAAFSASGSRDQRSLPTRRSFLTSLVLAAVAAPCGLASSSAAALPTAEDERKLALRIRLDGFGGANEADIGQVLRSAADEIWQHCQHTRFAQPGFEIYYNSEYPITHFDLSADGYIVIGLAVEGNLWARFAFQFGHEFAHALIDHSNGAKNAWHDLNHANQWLEESLCETASLFCLRAMAKTWQTKPPYPNWKSYAPALADYAAKRLAEAPPMPDGPAFVAWFAAEQEEMRKRWTRDKNLVIARQLLPLFEATPRGWESLPALKLGIRDATKPLAPHLAEWRANAPFSQHAFITRIAAEFGVKLSG